MSIWRKEDFEHVLVGATLLGAGGGGAKSSGERLLAELIAMGKTIEVSSVGSVPEDAVVASVANIGEPADASSSGPLFLHGPKQAFTLLQRASQTRYFGVLPGEIGPWNTMTPLLVAAQLGLPVIDGDGAGRAMPDLGMTSFVARGVPTSPLALANDDPDAPVTALLTGSNVDSVSSLVRGVIQGAAFGEVGGFATWQMTGAQLRTAAVPGGLTLAHRLGCAICGAATPEARIDAAMRVLTEQRKLARVLASGELVSIDEQDQNTFEVGRTVFRTSDGTLLTVMNMNENMIAWSSRSDAPVVIGPDLVCLIDADGWPTTNADLSRGDIGKHFTVLGTATAPELIESGALPAWLKVLVTLGYAGAYVPFS